MSKPTSTPPLIRTNRYLRDPVIRREMFIQTVVSSSAIEGVHLDPAELRTWWDAERHDGTPDPPDA